MGMFINEIDIDTTNPFKNDKLNRESEADNLTSLFSLVDNQMVLAIDSPWGTGKSSFLKMWNQKLMNVGYNTVFFNAWENDFVEDPFIAFIEELRENLNTNTDELIEDAVKLGLAILKNSPKALAKFIDNKTGINVEDIVSTDDISNLIGDKINEYKATKDSIKSFRVKLENIAERTLEYTEKPIVIFVDELDRCRPDFAIKLLERIKHLFSVKNIIFVLGIDKYALSNSVKVIYGESTQTNGYLARFIDTEYKLNDISTEKYIDYIIEKLEFSSLMHFHNDYNDFLKISEKLLVQFNLSLREIEKVLVEIYFSLKSETFYINPNMLVLLCTIRRIDKDIYIKMKLKQINFQEFIDTLNIRFKGFDKWIEDYYNAKLKASILWVLDDKNEVDRLSKLLEQTDKQSLYTSPVASCIKSYSYICDRWDLESKYIFEKIDFYHNISI